MVQKRNALGRGLDALLSMDEVQTEGSSSINEIELSKIAVNPNQPRREFDQTALQELADSIAEIGIIQPVTLRKLSDDEYQIIAGERRFRASQIAGLTSIPAYIRTADEFLIFRNGAKKRKHTARRPELRGNSACLSTPAGTIRTDPGTPQRTHRKETYHHRQLPAPAEAAGSHPDGTAKQADRHGTRPCLDNVGRPQTASEDFRGDTRARIFRAQGRGNREIIERRGNREKRRS